MQDNDKIKEWKNDKGKKELTLERSMLKVTTMKGIAI
jgi:hypothetical protein